MHLALLGVFFFDKQYVTTWKCPLTNLNCIFLFVGQERFTSMTRVYYKDAHACIIMFDLTQLSTFQNAVKWKKDLDTKCSLADGSPIPCLLLANKVLYNWKKYTVGRNRPSATHLICLSSVKCIYTSI